MGHGGDDNTLLALPSNIFMQENSASVMLAPSIYVGASTHNSIASGSLPSIGTTSIPQLSVQQIFAHAATGADFLPPHHPRTTRSQAALAQPSTCAIGVGDRSIDSLMPECDFEDALAYRGEAANLSYHLRPSTVMPCHTPICIGPVTPRPVVTHDPAPIVPEAVTGPGLCMLGQAPSVVHFYPRTVGKIMNEYEGMGSTITTTARSLDEAADIQRLAAELCTSMGKFAEIIEIPQLFLSVRPVLTTVPDFPQRCGPELALAVRGVLVGVAAERSVGCDCVAVALGVDEGKPRPVGGTRGPTSSTGDNFQMEMDNFQMDMRECDFVT